VSFHVSGLGAVCSEEKWKEILGAQQHPREWQFRPCLPLCIDSLNNRLGGIHPWVGNPRLLLRSEKTGQETSAEGGGGLAGFEKHRPDVACRVLRSAWTIRP